MLRRSEVHYLSGREVKMDIPANNFSHLYLATPSHRGWTRRGRNSVKRSRISMGLVLVLPLVAITLLWSYRIGSARSARTQSEASAKPVAPFQQLSSDGQGSLRAIIQAGNLSDLRWPNFSDYDKYVQKFYESYGFSLPWVRGMQPTAQAQQLIALLLKAEQEGLSAEDYDGPRWTNRLAALKPATTQPSEADAVRFDVALTVCVMRYVSDVHIGKVNPKHFDFGLDVETKKYDLSEFLKEDVVDASDVAAVMAKVEPPYPGYQRTIQALHSYLGFAKEYGGNQLPAIQKTIAPGDSYSGIPQLIHLLRLVGDLPTDANIPADETVYQAPLVEAVKNFQRRHGRTPDGRITTQILADLNVPLTKRVRQMQLTLERWRWLPVGLHSAPIVANIPEFRLRAYDENFKVALSMNVVVGKAYDHDTPVFSDSMQYVVFRPYWSVPYSIAKAEFIPRIARDPDYLAKKGFEVVNSRQDVVTSGTVTGDMLAQLRSGKLFIRQTPGPKNSLGLVKFIFPNSYNVYMHDTPAQEFFAKSRRDFSHGCIRLEKPADLAVWVLRDNPGWDMDRVRPAMNGAPNQQVNLAHPIPVLIVYGTAIVTEDGLVHFYDDIYGHDAALEKVLAKGYPYPG
jgi:murein L,D-transpeptidase YcbB/YkuD